MLKINWSEKAQSDLIEILSYWNHRNKSAVYSRKLNALFQSKIQFLAKFPGSGKRTDLPNVYVKIVRNYLLFYEVANGILFILTIRDSRRNPSDFNIK